MKKRLGVAHLKGGSGKSTTATTLAVLASDNGRRRVFLVDADPQHSASQMAADYGDSANFEYATEDDPRKLSRIRGDEYDLVVIDLPGYHDSAQLRALIEGVNGVPAVDALLIPTLEEALDLRALITLVKEVTTPAGMPYVAVLNRVHPYPHSIAKAEQTAEDLRAQGIRVMHPIIRALKAHSEAQWAGVPITHFGGRHSLARRAEADMRIVAATALGPELLKLRWAKEILPEDANGD